MVTFQVILIAGLASIVVFFAGAWAVVFGRAFIIDQGDGPPEDVD